MRNEMLRRVIEQTISARDFVGVIIDFLIVAVVIFAIARYAKKTGLEQLPQFFYSSHKNTYL